MWAAGSRAAPWDEAKHQRLARIVPGIDADNGGYQVRRLRSGLIVAGNATPAGEKGIGG